MEIISDELILGVRKLFKDLVRDIQTIAKEIKKLFDKLFGRSLDEVQQTKYNEFLTVTMRSVVPNDKLKKYMTCVVRSKIYHSWCAKFTCPFIERKK